MLAQAQQVVGLPTSHDSYIRHGWQVVAIPPNTKGPQHSGWNKNEGCLPADMELPAGWGVGLCHAYSGTCALDIDNAEPAIAYLMERGIDLMRLFRAPDAVAIDSGNPGHGKLIFKTPLGMSIPSKKIIIDGKVAFELRCGTADGLTVQDVLPPSRHPSGSTYRWAGSGNWQRLPDLPQQLFDLWQELLDKDKERSVSADTTFNASWSEITSAVTALDPDMGRDDWISVGMALHSTGHAESFDLWNSWSSKGQKYNSREMNAQWRSFKSKENGITLATLFKLAYDVGWKRPPPDIAELFKPVEQAPAETIKHLQLSTPAPRVDLSLWPTVLSNYAVEVGRQVGCDPVVPLMAGLAAVSAAIDKQSRLHINPTWTVPPVMWLMTVGNPSDKKTPGSKPMFVPLKQLEIEDRPHHELAIHLWKGIEARHAAETKAYREWAASPEAGFPGAVPPAVTPLPPEPVALRLMINDATSQKVVRLAAGLPRGFLLHLDEMHHFLKKINDPKGGEDRGCWIHGYEAVSYTMDRMGTGTTHADNLAVPIYGNCQPTVFKEQMISGGTDGLIQRFIPIVLDGSKTTTWADRLPPFMSHFSAYESMIRHTFRLPKTDYELSVEVENEFRHFGEWCHRLRVHEEQLRASPIYLTALGKVEGLCARLAFLLHVMQSPDEKQLNTATMRQAIAIMRQFFVPAIRYAFMEVVGLKDELAAWVTEYIIQHAQEQPTITLSEIRRSARRQLEGRQPWQADEDIKAIMDELARVEYVTLFESHPRHTSWTINPALAQQFADYRKAVILAKQQIKTMFAAESLKRGGTADPRYHSPVVGYESLP